MRYVALATDYDDTLAEDGSVAASVVARLERLATSGRKLLLVTGRLRGDLQRVFPLADTFDAIVAENGATFYRPGSEDEEVLALAPPPAFARELERRGVAPLSLGRVIVATRRPHEAIVQEVIRDMGLELQVIFNKGAVMVLPSGVNKATGLAAALVEFGLSPSGTVAVGDAENDHAMLEACGCGVAVANATPALKADADLVMERERGDGVVELVDRMLANDLADVPVRARASRRR